MDGRRTDGRTTEPSHPISSPGAFGPGELKKRYEAEGANEYRKANKRIQKAVKKAKEAWQGAQCEEIETCLNKNNNKRAYQLVKDLTAEKQRISPQLYRASLGNVLLKKKRFSADGQNIAHNCTTMRVVEQRSTGLHPAPGRRSATDPP